MKWRILIVDDEEDVRLIVKTSLQSNYEVVEAHDGLDALEKIERFEPDFVVMDVMMPLMNGFEACAALRKNARYVNLPVMFLSALGNKEDIKKGYSAGANLYLTKPFDPARLLKNIDLFFERTPPERRSKRYSIDQISLAEKEGHVPKSPGSHDWYPPHAETRTDIPRPAIQPEKPHAPAHLPRVLVVDDDPEMCTLIRMTLADLYEVVFAHDGMEAIERLVKYQPDILMIDVMLPKMNGYQLCQSLRTNRAFMRMPIVMCSAKGTDRDVALAKRIGANEYVVKPFSATELINKVNGMQKLPGFQVRPKSIAIASIVEIESNKAEQDVFDADESSKEKSSEKGALRKFLAKEGGKDAIEREAPEGEKKKRRLFGFGSKE